MVPDRAGLGELRAPNRAFTNQNRFYLEELLPIFTTAIKFAHTETIASASSGVQAVRTLASGTRSSGIDDCTDLCRPVSLKEAKEVQIAN